MSMLSHVYKQWMLEGGALLLCFSQWMFLESAFLQWFDCLAPILWIILYGTTLYAGHHPQAPVKLHRNHVRWRAKMERRARKKFFKQRYLSYKGLFHRSLPLKSRNARLYPFPSDLIRQVNARRKKKQARQEGIKRLLRLFYAPPSVPPTGLKAFYLGLSCYSRK
jgi:hypothetical protein